MQHACAMLCYNLWPLWIYHILPHYLTKGTNFEKKVAEHEMCSDLPTEMFLILRRHQRDFMINVHRSSCYACPSLMKLEFSRQTFEKSSKFKFHENPSSESRVVPGGWTGRHKEANSHFSLFYNRA